MKLCGIVDITCKHAIAIIGSASVWACRCSVRISSIELVSNFISVVELVSHVESECYIANCSEGNAQHREPLSGGIVILLLITQGRAELAGLGDIVEERLYGQFL
ncbi:hypothetical protein WK04_15670 [Burkholderia ubonensis]|nr:hypothetical protein WK04_15670 [Burkholderia ubonensis]